MAALLSHSPRRFLRLLKPKILLPRTISQTMTSSSPPHLQAGNPPPKFGVSGGSSAPPQWHTDSSDPSPSATPLQERRRLTPSRCPPTPRPAQEGDSETNLNRKSVKIMTYNVWSRKEMELSSRMNAIGDLIQQHSPDLICLQEVTPDIYPLLKNSDWWGEYECSLSCEWAMKRKCSCMQMSKLPVDSFGHHTVKGRGLLTADVTIGGVAMVDTFSNERVAQARKCLRILKRLPNVVFCGDMNWNEKLDGPFPLWMHGGWVDAWEELRPDEDGWTYDTKANPMLSANKKLQKRPDRFVCRLTDFDMDSIEMIGQEAVPGVSYVRLKTVGGVYQKLVLPILPSDHFGLVLTITCREAGSDSPNSEME